VRALQRKAEDRAEVNSEKRFEEGDDDSATVFAHYTPLSDWIEQGEIPVMILWLT
jgi:hypothetical protein